MFATKIRRSWVVWYVLFIALNLVLGLLLLVLTSREFSLPDITLLTFAATTTVIFTLASTNYHEYESKQNMQLLRWLFATRLSTKLQYFIVTVFATLLVSSALRAILPQVKYVACVDASLNFSVWIIIVASLYYVVHITGKKRV